MIALFRMAYRNLAHRRARSLLTVAGILIGVAGIAAIISTGQNLGRAQQAAYANASQADISFWVWQAPPALERAISGIANVTAVELRQDWFTRCRWTPRGTGEMISRDVALHGMADYAHQRVDEIRLVSGRFPRVGELVAEQSAMAAAPLSTGDVLSCRPRAGGPEQRLTLVGIIQSPNYPSAAILDYLTLYGADSDLQALLGANGANSLLLKLSDPTRSRETAGEVMQLLDRRHISHGGPTIRDPDHYLGKRELDALLLLLLSFSIVGLVMSGLLVANTLSAIVAEQAGEIGVIKAIGGTRGQVLAIYLIAAGLYGLAGTLLGLVFGSVLSWCLLVYIGSLLSLDSPFAISPEGLALGIVVGMGVTLSAAIWPAMIATRITIKDALESYGINSTFGVGRVDRLVRRLVAIPPLAAMSLRNLARRRARTIVTLGVIAVAVATFLAAQAVSASVNGAIDGLFQTYRADAWIDFGEYVSTAYGPSLRALPYVRQAEIWSMQDGWVTSERAPGRLATQARLWGLPAATTLYSPAWVAGRWYRADEADAVAISSDLAAAQGLRVGDRVTIDSGSDSRPFRVVGILVDNSVFLGSQIAGKVFMPESVLAMMQRRSGYATLFALGLDVHDAQGVQDRLDRIMTQFKRFELSSDSAWREVRSSREQTQVLVLALAAMTALIGVVGALGVMNTLTLNVLERRRELGILRVLGAEDRHFAQALLAEGAAFGLGGWLFGLGAGYALGMILTRTMQAVLFQIPYRFTPDMVVSSLFFALGLSVAGSFLPALGAARQPVGQALRYE